MACLDDLLLGAKSTELVHSDPDHFAWGVNLLVILSGVEVLDLDQLLDAIEEPYTNMASFTDDSIDDSNIRVSRGELLVSAQDLILQSN